MFQKLVGIRPNCFININMLHIALNLLEYISTTDLTIGDCLQIGWLPDRLCEVRYLGENRFVAERCENSKLQVGDTFSCLQFTLGHPLTMNDLCRNNTLIGKTYVVGQKNGLITLTRIVG